MREGEGEGEGREGMGRGGVKRGGEEKFIYTEKDRVTLYRLPAPPSH